MYDLTKYLQNVHILQSYKEMYIDKYCTFIEVTQCTRWK